MGSQNSMLQIEGGSRNNTITAFLGKIIFLLRQSSKPLIQFTADGLQCWLMWSLSVQSSTSLSTELLPSKISSASFLRNCCFEPVLIALCHLSLKFYFVGFIPTLKTFFLKRQMWIMHKDYFTLEISLSPVVFHCYTTPL